MIFFDKNYYSADFFFKNKFGKKVYKISIDAGFTCPNRDGSISSSGCIFCSPRGSGDFCSSTALSITNQISEGIKKIHAKNTNGLLLPYFQAFTNTYAPVDTLRAMYEEAISYPGAVGVAIATRPDCLSDDVIELLSDLSQRTYVQVELGLQTIHDDIAFFINRGYDLKSFEYNYYRLRKLNVHIVIHQIIGLPGETIDDYKFFIRYISAIKADGIKIQLLHIIKDTLLEQYHIKNPVHCMSINQYIDTVSELLTIIEPGIVIHRLTGDAPWKTLIEPQWSTDKKRILNGIQAKLKLSLNNK